MDQQPQQNPEMQSDTPPQEEGAPQMPAQEEVSSTPPQKPMGPMLGIVIIVILLILGGFYFWGTQLTDTGEEAAMTAEEIANQEDVALENLESQSNSDEIADIEADLDTTDLESLDSELDAIDLELGL